MNKMKFETAKSLIIEGYKKAALEMDKYADVDAMVNDIKNATSLTDIISVLECADFDTEAGYYDFVCWCIVNER